ncbi:DNA-binding transcriptional regulator, LysR family [Amycolatopsis marina]|uniref:DNA-binding transcriptional regulator, LysR family n=1 Tax=Amycolatopsis marina TaxID=490629 RepID=A0A1I1C0L1_9PSEU|nr:LysR family transcriptional regulator [Amycolatopsis marina]SFB56155.1 DNA-binding transcriptional regulator, LysR family [Amycolatopsis marina]
MATLRQLEYLVTIVDEGSFTRAAALLHVTQPALSHQVRALEKSIGGPLLERATRSVRPTPMGRAMLPHARAVLADAERARCAARQASDLQRGELQLATVYSVGLGVLPPVLRTWRRSHPGIRIRLFEHRHADELRDAMLAGEADLAVGPPPREWEGDVRPLGTEEFVVVLPPDDPAASATDIELRTLADRDWVHYAPGNGLADVVDQACAAAGFQPRAAVHTEQSAAAPQLAAAGLGPALVPANVIPPRFTGRLLRPDPPVRRPLAAYTRGETDPVTRAFVDTLIDTACVLPTHVERRLRPE